MEQDADDDVAVTGLESGDLTFDRATATAELVASGADDQDVEASFDRDLAGVRRMAAKLRRMTRVDEGEVMRRRYLSIEPTPRRNGVADRRSRPRLRRSHHRQGLGAPRRPAADGPCRGARGA